MLRSILQGAGCHPVPSCLGASGCHSWTERRPPLPCLSVLSLRTLLFSCSSVPLSASNSSPHSQLPHTPSPPPTPGCHRCQLHTRFWAWIKAKGSNSPERVKGQVRGDKGLLRAQRAHIPMRLGPHPVLGQGGALMTSEQESLLDPCSDLCGYSMNPSVSVLCCRPTQREPPGKGGG